ncbi:kynurenine formamidase-like [Liolophura sinensis]|uniref:kynurenine formamidase-like n=1 Tax=Liolophura sinensis TaxID=3198878 RepID=UPI00315910B1
MDKDQQYSPSQHSHRMTAGEVIDAHVSHLTTESQKARETIEFEEVSYGDRSGQKLQIFGAKTLPSDAPILVYIHGGYWQELSMELSSFMVTPLFKAGCIVIPIGYDLAPTVSMTEIVSQVKKAVGYVLHMAKRRESRGVYLCGHSAGGHLAAMMLAVNWIEEIMVSSSLIKGAMLVSGIYDVRPLVETYINKPLQMTQ